MKRVISIGLSIPAKLEDNTIYISLELIEGEGIKANAVSKEDFKYDCHAIAGNLLHLVDKKTSNESGNVTERWLTPYKGFLDNLIDNNDCVLNYDRLVEESVYLNSKHKCMIEML